MNIDRALIHEFLGMINSYYEIKCSTGTLTDENHYSIYVVFMQPML